MKTSLAAFWMSGVSTMRRYQNNDTHSTGTMRTMACFAMYAVGLYQMKSSYPITTDTERTLHLNSYAAEFQQGEEKQATSCYKSYSRSKEEGGFIHGDGPAASKADADHALVCRNSPEHTALRSKQD